MRSSVLKNDQHSSYKFKTKFHQKEIDHVNILKYLTENFKAGAHFVKLPVYVL